MIKAFAGWWRRRRARERALALGALLIAALAVVDAVAFAPQRAQSATLRKQLAAARQQHAQLRALAEQHAAQGDAASRLRQAQLGARRAQAEAALLAAQDSLMSPRDMVRQLETMLATRPQLRVIGLRSQPPQPLGGGAVANDPAAAPAAAPVPPAAALYQHGIELSVRGPYLELLAWLEQLERAPHRLYWREIDLKVGADGVPVTRIALFTLSREAVWLQL